MSSEPGKILKHVLKNGLTVLARPIHLIPKVSIQLWYNVGSKDEKNGQRGIAHLIEHMIFKGTKTLTESDINLITYKLSGYCNAFTSYDYTGYLFDFPSHHWVQALPIMADCMTNCTFKEEFLASEMKAVIQELKMYRDDYTSSLVEAMISGIFVDHPYHYPIIGFKQDLWCVKRDELLAFYQEHYVPNNATLVVVGDASYEEIVREAEKYFGGIKSNPSYKRREYYSGIDIISKSITLYRDVKQPTLILAWVVPGARQKYDYYFDVLSWIVGRGKGSRLYHLLIDELQLATDVEAFCYDLFDNSLFFIYVQPKDINMVDDIIKHVHDIFNALSTSLSEEGLLRAMNQVNAQYLSMLENNQKQAYVIGQSYLATGDDQFLFNYLKHDAQEVSETLKQMIKMYFRPSLTHIGKIATLSEQDQDYWKIVQERSDQEDARILSCIKRDIPVEKGRHVHSINIAKAKPFLFPRPEKLMLSNQVPVYYFHNPNIPRIQVSLALKANHYYDPQNLEGLYTFLCASMVEGTKRYTSVELAQAIETRGMSLAIAPGQVTMNMARQDLEVGLDILMDILTNATFSKEGIEKVRGQLIADLKEFWDTPTAFAGQLAREQVYKNHPYSKKVMGDFASIGAIRRDDLIDAYQKFITPDGAALAIVGDLAHTDLKKILENTIARWQGPKLSSIEFPLISDVHGTVTYPINRDQVVLSYAGKSISRFDPEYDKVLLFDQLFTGGVLGAMSSRLFALREASGLFYTIGGSLLSAADEQPGMIFIRTIVSLDRLIEAEQAIENVFVHATDIIADQELQQAKAALISSFVDHFASNRNIAQTFLFLHRYNLPDDYFDTRALQLDVIKPTDIPEAVQKLLDIQRMVKIKIGRF